MNRHNILNVAALTGLIRVNSSFSIATFVSIIITVLFSTLGSLNNSSKVAEKLLINLVMSFKSFLFAWLLAQCLKLTAKKRYMGFKDMVVRGGTMLSALFSGFGFYFMVSSLKQVTVGANKVTMFSLNCVESSAGAVGCMGGSVYMAIAFYFIALFNIAFRGKEDDPE